MLVRILLIFTMALAARISGFVRVAVYLQNAILSQFKIFSNSKNVLRAVILSAVAVLLSSCSMETALQNAVPKYSKPQILISNLTVIEGTTGQVTLTLNKRWSADVIVPYASTAITAEQGTDYTAMNANVTIPKGSLSATSAVSPVLDGVY